MQQPGSDDRKGTEKVIQNAPAEAEAGTVKAKHEATLEDGSPVTPEALAEGGRGIFL